MTKIRVKRTENVGIHFKELVCETHCCDNGKKNCLGYDY